MMTVDEPSRQRPKGRANICTGVLFTFLIAPGESLGCRGGRETSDDL